MSKTDADEMRAKIASVAKLTRDAFPPLQGTWAIEADKDEGGNDVTIAVMRDASGRPLAFMHPDDLRALWESKRKR